MAYLPAFKPTYDLTSQDVTKTSAPSFLWHWLLGGKSVSVGESSGSVCNQMEQAFNVLWSETVGCVHHISKNAENNRILGHIQADFAMWCKAFK